MRDFITQGRVPKVDGAEVTDEILMSTYLANRLHLKLGDRCQAIFPKRRSSTSP